VLLCVPDGEVARAAAAVTRRPGVLVGHCSGALPLGGLDLSVHPLMTVTGRRRGLRRGRLRGRRARR
jgi:predicted short-subunit dehydrogenase-like oxidoreductase (DUF2520 family)